MIIKELDLAGARIVEFEPRLAASIADMWNASDEGWNGESWNMTEQSVINEETNAEHIGLYLVIDERDNVMGYCKLEEYYDKKAVYIPLLNVVPKHWNKKYGKALILKALNDSIKSGYERLDLHSWSGNNKAVPLYKKIGFRWQTNNSAMYMQNYLPFLMNLKIIQPYFEKMDWYDDCICELALEPDSIMENNFELLHYCWKKDEIFLEADFDADAKGLKYLKCNEFSVKLKADDRKVFFGKRQIFLEIVNNSVQPLECDILLKGEAAIEAGEQKHISILDRSLESFDIEVSDDIMPKSGENPAVLVELKINGLPLPLKMSLKPMAPVSVSLRLDYKRIFRPGKMKLFLQLKNNLKENVRLNTELINLPQIDLLCKRVEAKLSAEETKVITLDAVLKKGCYYDQKIKVQMNTDKEIISYIQKLKLQIPDLETTFHGEAKKFWFIQKGSIKLLCFKENTQCPIYLEAGNKDFWYFMRAPRLSEPYEREFSNVSPENVSFRQTEESTEMKIIYKSRNKQILASHIFILQKDNILLHNWEIENIGAEKIQIPHLETCFDSAATHAVYDGRLLEMECSEKNRYWRKLPIVNISPGWMFFDKDGFTAAISWDCKRILKFGEWWQRVIYELGDLMPARKINIQGESIALNHFSSWQDFYTWFYNSSEFPNLTRLRDLVINDNNPFCDPEIYLTYYDRTGSVSEKTLRVIADNQIVLTDKFAANSWQAKICRKNKIKLEIEEEAQIYSFEKFTFQNFPENLNVTERMENNEIISLMQSNKLLVKTCPSFNPGIFSLNHQGLELLSSSFPKAYTRGWDNHWFGGISTKPRRISQTLLANQKYTLNSVTRLDMFDNKWQGFSYSVKYDENIPELHNITICYNYLISPSQDVIAIFNEVIASDGAFVNYVRAYSSIFLNEETPLKIHCDKKILKLSEGNASSDNLNFAAIEFGNSNNYLYLYAKGKFLSASIYCKMAMMSFDHYITGIEPDAIKASQPLFLVIADQLLSEENLKALDNFKWR
jgi:ribosomal protein S18 acetylase RimI-like enzyme